MSVEGISPAVGRSEDVFYPNALDSLHHCSGGCGEVKPAGEFPTLPNKPWARLKECAECIGDQSPTVRPEVPDALGQTSESTEGVAPSKRDVRRAQKATIPSAVRNMLISQPDTAVTFDEILRVVSIETDFLVTQDEITACLRKLVTDDERCFKIARNVYAWSPNLVPPPPPAPSRVLQMIEQRWLGRTLDEIGHEFGVTRERVRQLLKKYGGPSAEEIRERVAEVAKSTEAARQDVMGRKIGTAIGEGGAISVREVAERSGLDQRDVTKYWPVDLAHLRLWESGQHESRWTDEEILAALREGALYEYPLTTNAYAELIKVGQIEGPSVPRIGQRFGSWSAACAAAGVVAGEAWKRDYGSKWSDEDLLQVVRAYVMDPRFPNSAHRFDGWRREYAPDGPSFATLRNRFGSWTEVKRRAFAQNVGTGE